MSNPYRESVKGARQTVAEDGRWLIGVPAIVADNQDPERQHRVRVIIPSIDEDLIYDEWARQMVFCLGLGFGSVFVPPVGSEVVLFGQLGQKHNLFFASLYNEEQRISASLSEMVAGIHAPGDLKFIATQLAALFGLNVDVNATELAQLLGQNVRSVAEQENKIQGQTIKLEGSTITISGDGTISITGGNVTIGGDSVKIHGRTVNKVGPAI